MPTTLVDPKYHVDGYPLQNHRAWTRETYYGSQHHQTWRYHQVQLLSIPEPGHQLDRSRHFEVLYLRLPVGSKVFHHIHYHRLGIYLHGHHLQLPYPRVRKFRLHTLRGELE